MFDKADKESKLDEETDWKLTTLPEWLSSRNDFNEAAKLINDFRDDANNVKSGSGDKKVFLDLKKLINDISNNKFKKESAIKRMKKSITELKQLRQKERTVFQNKMIHVLCYLFNSFGLSEKPLLFIEENPD